MWTKRWTIQQFKEEDSKLKDEIDLLNLNQEMNNPAIQRREFQTQRWNWSLKPELRDEHPAIQIENSKLKDEIESLKHEPRDEQFSSSKKIIPNSKMKLIPLNLSHEMNNPAIQRREFQAQRWNWIP
jgi:hypothetical protein